jgi:NADH:ubiquinone oxidoreductase subunit 5 (subunit L)/multisubunit Na+/H+ antiporter MnhA subunit
MEKIILFAPLVGALIGGFGWRVIGEKGAQILTTGLLFLAAFLSWVVFLGFDGQTLCSTSKFCVGLNPGRCTQIGRSAWTA